LRHWFVFTLIALLCAAFVVTRAPLLQQAGSHLVVSDPLAPADAIVVTVGAGGPGLLEAADLFHAGIAPRVAIFADPPDLADQEFLRRGVPYENQAARWRRQLQALGVAHVEEIPRTASGSEAEGLVLPAWCSQRHVRSIVVVTTTDHARRVRRVLRRAMNDRVTVTIRPARFSPFQPSGWWRSRDGLRTGLIETEKLVLDVFTHPFD
jgi:uncharacterized SAM-binding protein YcdF (DUF218 family)